MVRIRLTFGQRNDTILHRWINPEISEEEINQISESKEVGYRHEILKYRITLLPGAAHWLQEMRSAGRRQALATMAGRANVDAIFSVLNIEQYFDAVVSGDEVARGKPEPDVFFQAAAKLGIPADRCIVVEDSPAGIEAAKRAGMKSIGVNQNIVLPADWAMESLAQLSPNSILGIGE